MADRTDHHYSGENSKRFWKRVNALPNPAKRELFACGVLLQEMESRILTWLQREEQRRSKRRG